MQVQVQGGIKAQKIKETYTTSTRRVRREFIAKKIVHLTLRLSFRGVGVPGQGCCQLSTFGCAQRTVFDFTLLQLLMASMHRMV